MFILRVPHVTSSDAREGVSGVLALSICRFLRGWLITKRTYLSDLRRARSHDFPWLRGFVETDLNEGKSVWLRREETKRTGQRSSCVPRKWHFRVHASPSLSRNRIMSRVVLCFEHAARVQQCHIARKVRTGNRESWDS